MHGTNDSQKNYVVSTMIISHTDTKEHNSEVTLLHGKRKLHRA